MSDADDGPQLFSLRQMESLLYALEADLAKTNDSADLYVVGGAACAYLLGSDRLSEDIDAAMKPHRRGIAASATIGPVRDSIRRVADAEGLRANWLNDSAGGMLPPTPDENYRTWIDTPHLRVRVAGPEIVLAMKVMAARDKDESDMLGLASLLDLASADQVLATTRRVMATENIPVESGDWVRRLMPPASP